MTTFNTGAYPPGVTQRDVDEAAQHYDDYPDEDVCPNCGGEGVIYDCLDGFCEDAESGCELCERSCDWCNARAEPRKARRCDGCRPSPVDFPINDKVPF